MLPRPPMMTIRKASMMSVWSIPRVTLTVGATRTPPKPARKQPMTKTIANIQLTLDPNGPDHLPVHRGRPGDLTQLGFVDHEPEGHGDDGAGDQEKDIVPRERKPPEKRHGPLEDPGNGYGLVLAPPDHFYQVSEDQGEGKGEQDEHQVFPLVKELEDPPLRQEADEGHRQGCQEEGHQEAKAPAAEDLRYREGHKGADHVERTMGHIRYPKYSQDEAQA